MGKFALVRWYALTGTSPLPLLPKVVYVRLVGRVALGPFPVSPWSEKLRWTAGRVKRVAQGPR